MDNFEDQWKSFLPKVRNNYRKALSHYLSFKLFHAQEITEKIIESFHKIYVGTMDRNNAPSTYFFSWSYFKNLIMENLDNFSIAMVYYDKKPISTELIINYKETIFAFLGGTEAEYFKCRPNDFLRVEVIKWAIHNNMKYYVLGGGIKDGDGLYKHKKSLFPKEEDMMFYTGRKVIDQEIYAKLCFKANRHFADIPEPQLKHHFFPFYRAEQLIEYGA